jgi:hypothetical protein
MPMAKDIETVVENGSTLFVGHVFIKVAQHCILIVHLMEK